MPELFGREVAPAWGGRLTWSPSDDDLIFISPDLRTARAYRVSAGGLRELSVLESGQIYDAVLSADGQEAFTSTISADGTTRTIWQHTTAGSTVLTNRGLGSTLGLSGGGSVLTSPTHPVAAFLTSPDSLFLLHRGSVPTLLGTGCEGIVAFSPDESRLLCKAGLYPQRFSTFRTDGGGAELLALPEDVARNSQVFRWDATGIKVLYRSLTGPTSIMMYDHTTGTSRGFLPAVSFPELSQWEAMSWSADGTKAAYSTLYCAQMVGILGGCRISQQFFYVFDVASGVRSRVAVHTGEGGQVALSRTGARMAYVANQRLYLLDVR